MYKPYPVKELIHIDYIYSLFESCYSCGYNFPGETHDFWECLYVKKGEVCASGDERIYHLEENDIIFHKPLELHKFYVDRSDGADVLVFSFNASGSALDFFRNKAFRFNNKQKNMMEELLEYIHDYTYPECSRSERFPKYMTRFKTDTAFSQIFSVHIYRIMLSLLGQKELKSIFNTRDAAIFSDAVRFMTINLSDNLSTETIAGFCGTSQTSLKRIFLKYSGYSVHKYLLKLKVNTAMRLLDDNVSITKIADMLGFSSQAHFSSAFKRETEMSPTKYKNQ